MTSRLKVYTIGNPKMLRMPKISDLMKRIDEHKFDMTSLFDRDSCIA